MTRKPPTKGDYVLATKYADGDPKDQWAVGFYDKQEGDRHYVTDEHGHQFRHNGFRRVKTITGERGKWLLEIRQYIEESGRSIWFFARRTISVPKESNTGTSGIA